MFETLTGSVVGADREVIINRATAQTANYFGTDCIEIKITEVSVTAQNSEGMVIFYEANYTGTIRHEWVFPGTGVPDLSDQAICRVCGDKLGKWTFIQS